MGASLALIQKPPFLILHDLFLHMRCMVAYVGTKLSNNELLKISFKFPEQVNGLIGGAVAGAAAAAAAGTRSWSQVIGMAGLVSVFCAAADYSRTS